MHVSAFRDCEKTMSEYRSSVIPQKNLDHEETYKFKNSKR